MGRPNKWTKEEIKSLTDEILSRLMDGESLRKILPRKADSDNVRLPSRLEFYTWIEQDKDLFNRYARAREIQADELFDEILSVAYTTEEGQVIITKESGGTEVKVGDMIAHRRLKIDSIKWMLGKMYPKRFGERLELNGELNTNTILFQNVSKQFKDLDQ